MTNDEAKAWINALDQAHKESVQMAVCAHWAIKMLNQMREKVLEQNGNVYSFKTGKQLIGSMQIEAWPDGDQPMRNFQMIGKAIDHWFHQINILLPDSKDKK